MAKKPQPNETVPTSASAPFLPGDLAPTIYVDGLEGFIYNEDVAKINIFEDVIFRTAAGGTTVHRRTSAHLVIPHRVLDQIHHWLGENIARRNQKLAEMNSEQNKSSTSEST